MEQTNPTIPAQSTFIPQPEDVVSGVRPSPASSLEPAVPPPSPISQRIDEPSVLDRPVFHSNSSFFDQPAVAKTGTFTFTDTDKNVRTMTKIDAAKLLVGRGCCAIVEDGLVMLDALRDKSFIDVPLVGGKPAGILTLLSMVKPVHRTIAGRPK